MAYFHLLGTGAAISDPHRTTTMLCVTAGDETVVVDCGGDVIQRILASGIALETVEALIITHEHADHVSGFPLFMEKLWLSGRRRPIPVYGPKAGIDQARRCFETFDTSNWDGLPVIDWNPVPLENEAIVLESERLKVEASPGDHGVPVIGLRFLDKRTQQSMTYSSDTAPTSSIINLAKGSRFLVHEASGAGRGHSSVADAARVSSAAGAGQAILVHLPPDPSDTELQKATTVFPWIQYGDELERFEF